MLQLNVNGGFAEKGTADNAVILPPKLQAGGPAWTFYAQRRPVAENISLSSESEFSAFGSRNFWKFQLCKKTGKENVAGNSLSFFFLKRYKKQTKMCKIYSMK